MIRRRPVFQAQKPETLASIVARRFGAPWMMVERDFKAQRDTPGGLNDPRNITLPRLKFLEARADAA